MSQPSPRGWFVWDSGDGIRVSAPVEFRQQPVPGTLMLRAEHDGVLYSVGVFNDLPQVQGSYKPAEHFEIFLNNFAESSGYVRDGLSERLWISGYPCAQAHFAAGDMHAVVRVMHPVKRTVSLSVLMPGEVSEENPAIGGFLNSLKLD
nr:hypothetical protein [Fimbriiglobus ruber]